MATYMYTAPAQRLASSSRRRRVLIHLTPLIDVVFILLVFFMLASSFLDWRAIALDTSASLTVGPTDEHILLIELGREGIRLDGEPIALEALAARVAERVSQTPNRRVLIKPLGGVSMQDTVAVLDRLTMVGVDNLSLIRDPNL